MAILKCKMCGGDIEMSADKTFGTCESCGSTMTFPKVDDEQRANMFNRGNHFRRTGEFDKALAVYERIVQEDETDAEAHWCCALCRFGIEYVEDPNTFEYLPTCHRASFDSFLEDVDYLAALEHSDGITRRQYQKDAAKIAEVQRGILATSQNEEPFDVFICYKESEADGTRTRDSLMAQEIYYQLTEQGRRVFFSRITLEDKAGTEYEPYIFAALNSAKVMILVTTSAEHANAVWVKNEWSRFLSLMRKDRSKLLLPCYRDMDPYDLPEALSVLQSYDMSKIGFIQDLIRGVNKVLDASTRKTKETVKETVVIQQQAQSNVAPLLKRAFMFLEDGDFTRADEFCEQVLNLEPENGEAYLGKLMAELKVKKRENLKECAQPFDNLNNYRKALRFGDDALKKKLTDNIAFINDRNETARKEGIYSNALALKNAGKVVEAKSLFESIADYKDAGDRIGDCAALIEKQRKDFIYNGAMVMARENGISRQQRAIEQFRTIPGWRDADAQIAVCERRIEEIKAKEEADRIERERKAEEARIAEERAAKRRKRAIAIALACVAAAVAFVILLFTVILPSEACQTVIKNHDYDAAIALYSAGEYEEAIAAFKALNGYKDSDSQIENCYIGKYGEEKYNFIKNSKAGDTYIFGSYEQNNNKSDGKEEIEWIVLKKDGMSLLLISKYALDCKPYNTSNTKVTWENCSLRKWLNGTFINNAFSADEQAMIQSTTVKASKNPYYSTDPGNSTTDKLFLLSIQEVIMYFGSDAARQCKGTDYCYAQGAKDRDERCYWWLRSPGYNSYMAEHIGTDGSIDNFGMAVDYGVYAVRPALWINFE